MRIPIKEVSFETEDMQKEERNDTRQREVNEDTILQLKMALEEKEKKCQSLLADFQRLKKKVLEEVDIRVQEEKEKFLVKIVEVVDNFDRAIASGKNYRQDSFFNGMLFIYKQILTLLRDFGVERIDSIKKEFDPHLHEAVSVVQSNTFERNTIVDELEKGYLIDDKLLRPAKVQVAL